MAQSFDQFSTLEDLGDLAPILRAAEYLGPDETVSLITAGRRRHHRALHARLCCRGGHGSVPRRRNWRCDVIHCRGHGACVSRRSGGRRTFGILDRGKSFGGMALIENMPRSATCVVPHDCMFAAMTRANFEHLTADHPRLAITVLKDVARMLSNRLRHANETREGGIFDFLDLT